MKILGMDMGTTNTYIYASDGISHAPVPLILPRISDETGGIATVVLYEDDAPLLVGNIAESEYHTNRARQGRRELRCQFKPEIAHGQSMAIRWMTDFLRGLHAALPEGLLEPDTLVHVGMPSRIREDFSLNLARCFLDAGWPRPAFVRESDAAMISCLQTGALDIEDIESKALILDFGGGTCDFTTLERMEVLQSSGDGLFGGRLFDDLLFQVFCAHDPQFAREVPGTAGEYFIHWIQCKAEKERFSEAVGREDGTELPAAALRAVWRDAAGQTRESYVHGYGRDDFIRDAENYAASPAMLEMLSPYLGQGGMSPEARDLLEGRRIGLLSWFRSILRAAGDSRDIHKVILTGGSSRWFFVSQMAHEIFPAATCSTSRRTYEDIACGLALYPVLAASHERVRALLEQKVEPFAEEACQAVRSLFSRQATLTVRQCTERIVERDIMPVLEDAQKNSRTVEELERAFAENIRKDEGLLAIINDRTEALRAELEYELQQRFRVWLKENGVFLTPRLAFSARTLTRSFFDAVSVKVTHLAFLNIMDFMVRAVLPGIAAYAVGGAIAHTGEPVSAVLGGSVAFAGVWGLGKVAKGFLWKRRLPKFFLNEKNRRKIVEKNKAYIEKALDKAFGEVLDGMTDETGRKLRQALHSMLTRLSVLNQVRVAG
ncbi:MAG: molecular chaperone [Desulfovibrionaceae bacterium]|nr:molecular chaperone [Desulfovibrionaceae bacterium]